MTTDLMFRMKGEYGEMPGLRLTASQASRLWDVDASTCEAALGALVREGFLHRTPNGHYVALPRATNLRAAGRPGAGRRTA